jgi:hypothetical protein
MRKSIWLLAAACSLVAACGGGSTGGDAGVNPIAAPPPAPPPPPPPNASLTDLQFSQTFASDSASSAAQLDLSAKATVGGTTSLSNVTVHYDAASKSYTIDSSAGTQTFAPADVLATAYSGETHYEKQQGANHDYLTLVHLPYTSTTPLQYVDLGYWQRNNVVGSTQNTSFDIFAYGLATPATAVPRTGVATYGVDAFGFFITPGISPKGVEGHGTFTADFLTGVYSTSSTLFEFDLTSPNVSIGSLLLDSAGKLSATDGTFTGDISYRGNDAAVAGKMTGRFYGPGAQELGGSFAADNGKGSALTGAFTGSRDPNAAPTNVALTNLVADQHFFPQSALLENNPALGQATTFQIIGGLDIRTDGTITYSPGLSSLPFATFTAADKVVSPPNWTTYQKVVNGQPLELRLFTPGPSNTQFALTYSSFGTWHTTDKSGFGTADDDVYFVYGIETPQGLLSRRTGTAHYDGILFGAGADRNATIAYDLSGTSHFDVDFGAQAFTGALAITGKDRADASMVDFGNYDFSGAMGFTKDTESMLMQAGQQAGRMTTRFYGPSGEEIGGSFQIFVPRPGGSQVLLTGATIAKVH